MIGDHPVEERAPVVELWIRAARRNGVEVITVGAAGTVQAAPGTAADVVREQVGKQIRAAQRAVLIWSGPGGQGGAVVAQLASELGAHAAFYLPATPNGRAVTEAWAAEGKRGPATMRGEIGVLLISGEEAVSDPQIRALALRAKAVIAITMFSEPARGFADLVLPGTSYLERDGTIVNLEGRPQRLRRAVIPPAPDEIAWIAKLAERFDVPIDPHERAVPNEEQAQLPPRRRADGLRDRACPRAEAAHGADATPLHLVRYRSLFSGPAVERVEELQFQRPDARDRHLAARCEPARNRHRRHGRRQVERHVGAAQGTDRQAARRGRGARPRGARARPRPGRGGEEAAVTSEPWWISVIKALIFINVLLISMAFLTLYERKLLARMQRRYGPNRAGPKGSSSPSPTWSRWCARRRSRRWRRSTPST